MNPVELIQPRFSSPFAEMFNEYVEVNRAVGKKFNTDIVYLEQFDTWCRASGIEEQRITKDIYGKWCEKRPNEKDTTFACRIRTFNRAVRYLHEAGHCDFVPGPAPRFRKDFVPYVFTREEIVRFFDVADHIKYRAVAPLAHEVWPLLFKMLYGCGLRKSEALKLRPRDVDLENGILTILNAKHNKDRLVPMSPSLTQLCRLYIPPRRCQKGAHTFFLRRMAVSFSPARFTPGFGIFYGEPGFLTAGVERGHEFTIFVTHFQFTGWPSGQEQASIFMSPYKSCRSIWGTTI